MGLGVTFSYHSKPKIITLKKEKFKPRSYEEIKATNREQWNREPEWLYNFFAFFALFVVKKKSINNFMIWRQVKMIINNFYSKNILIILISLIGMCISSTAFSADTGSESSNIPISGKELAQKVYDREDGDDSTAHTIMKLINKRGHERIRDFTFYSKDYRPLIKQLIRFTSPADIEGTGFLSIEKSEGETDQFLYLPALRRTRRIVSSQKSNRFVNSDFTYEDMERRPVEDSEHKITGKDKIGNIDCFVLESRPKEESDSQYSLLKSIIAKNIYIALSVEYYNKKGKLIKKYRTIKLEKIQDIWTETEVIMEDLKKEHKTILKINNIVYNTNLDDNIFSRQNLGNW
jgi:Outer membrane lipoprotein-sorting protein